MKKIITLTLGDLKNIFRDPMQMVMLIAPILMGAALRFIVPMGTNLLQQHLDFDLTPYYPLLTGFMFMMPPLMFGYIIGFIILDERDEQILQYYSVTPVGKSGYFINKILFPMVLSFVFSFIFILLLGYVTLDYVKLIPMAVMAALEAPIMALFLACFAANKVEGLALAKGFGLVLMIPIVAFFVSSPLTWALGIIPYFWMMKGFVSLLTPDPLYPLYIILGFLTHIGALVGLFVLFKKKNG